jgi:hypothetical protein
MDMKTYRQSVSTISIAIVLVLLGSVFVRASSKDAQAKAASRLALSIHSVPEVPIPPSVFILPGQPGEGRNPFFPQSSVRVVVPKTNSEAPFETYSFVLNGITSPPKRTAMINGRTFEPGEEGEVRLPSGAKMMIKCEEIKAESAIINFGGQRRELRLRSGV